MVLTVWSYAIKTCEPRQGGNAAAISSYFNVPQGSQTRANCAGNAGTVVSKIRHDFFIHNQRKGETMSAYQALYRKWRPMTFDDVVGQKHISDTLRGSVQSGRTSHAYLFCGTRGTGKTSTAKIFSRAVNCENPINGEPCNQCPTCKGILDGSILDVYEMDAASNRGVENIREIRDEVIYTPVGCKYKVYIIDEVHMLTAEAFNALLKTLEEPPRQVLFILATTEPHKIPSTVLSRCQRFDFRRISIDEISGRLGKIADAEKIDITPDALELVAELGDGSMRDAISVLDRCVAFGNEKLTTDRVAEIVGIVGTKRLFDIADAIARDNSRDALLLADEVLREGAEAQNLLENLLGHFRCLLLCKSAENPSELLEKTEQMAEKYTEQAEDFSVERLLYTIKALGECIAQAKLLSVPKVAVETAMVRLCSPAYSTDAEALLSRIEKLEAMVARLSLGGVAVVENKKTETVTAQEELPPWDIEEEERVPVKETAKEIKETKNTETVGEQWEFWSDALAEIKKESKSLFAFLYIAKPRKVNNVIEIEVGSRLAYDKIATPGGIDYLSKLFSRVGGEALSAEIFIKGERPKEEESNGPSIKDLAEKKSIIGTKMDID